MDKLDIFTSLTSYIYRIIIFYNGIMAIVVKALYRIDVNDVIDVNHDAFIIISDIYMFTYMLFLMSVSEFDVKRGSI